ncbi:MAG: hypothetical protein ABW007_07820 [Chitinophagaceae bacterium]
MNNAIEQQLNIWFKPWEYTHKSWVEDTIFTNLTQHEIDIGYIAWCKYIGISYEFIPYQNLWLQQYWLDSTTLILAINLLGSMLHKQKDNVSTVAQLRWAQRTALARPIFLTKPMKFTSNFETGINLLYQILQCYCPQIWTRFLLQLPKFEVQVINIHNEPLLTGKMILIIEKLWDIILSELP